MNVYNKLHAYYCGIDLHARTMYVCILDAAGQIVYHNSSGTLPKSDRPVSRDLVVGVECIFCWYWLADLCQREGIDFVLGHALYMRSIHGPPSGGKNDRIDSLKIARLIRGGNFPLPYVYPPRMRATRDLMRRRIHPDPCRDGPS